MVHPVVLPILVCPDDCFSADGCWDILLLHHLILKELIIQLVLLPWLVVGQEMVESMKKVEHIIQAGIHFLSEVNKS